MGKISNVYTLKISRLFYYIFLFGIFLLNLQGKQATVWEMGGTDSKSLDYSNYSQKPSNGPVSTPVFLPDPNKVFSF